MKSITNTDNLIESRSQIRQLALIRILVAGLLFPLGFAPFHLPGLTLISIALFYRELTAHKQSRVFLLGLVYGIASFGAGVSWVAISIHDYGQLDFFSSALITLAFVSYLALFPATLALVFKYLHFANRKILSAVLFASLWPLAEFARAVCFTGFPWLELGVSQLDTPARYLAPIIGIYGLSFLGCLAAALLAISFSYQGVKQRLYLIAFVLIIVSPSLFKNKQWTQVSDRPISVALIQANLSMRNKWDETLFWNLLDYYKSATQKLLGTELIVMPESAIPLPSSYVEDYLSKMDSEASMAGSAVILGLLDPINSEETEFANAVLALGNAQGKYIKQHLVPFGEYIPSPFAKITEWIGLPDPGIKPGSTKQNLIHVAGHPIANLICYEIAYQQILRLQFPEAEWIVSNSDNGWFGHSLASYQQLQMAQMLSLTTGRYQVVSNNDGLSSVIDNHGEIVEALPPFSAGILKSKLYPARGNTPWVIIGDTPYLLLALFFVLYCSFLKGREYFQRISC